MPFLLLSQGEISQGSHQDEGLGEGSQEHSSWPGADWAPGLCPLAHSQGWRPKIKCDQSRPLFTHSINIHQVLSCWNYSNDLNRQKPLPSWASHSRRERQTIKKQTHKYRTGWVITFAGRIRVMGVGMEGNFIQDDQRSVSDTVTRRRAEAMWPFEAKHSIAGRGNSEGQGHCISFLLLL